MGVFQKVHYFSINSTEHYDLDQKNVVHHFNHNYISSLIDITKFFSAKCRFVSCFFQVFRLGHQRSPIAFYMNNLCYGTLLPHYKSIHFGPSFRYPFLFACLDNGSHLRCQVMKAFFILSLRNGIPFKEHVEQPLLPEKKQSILFLICEGFPLTFFKICVHGILTSLSPLLNRSSQKSTRCLTHPALLISLWSSLGEQGA